MAETIFATGGGDKGMEPVDVIVAGGGIGGLATAYALEAAFAGA
ncbi:hypothetical protein [Nonomuraea phyllanthi]|nr:hypothetical protein [Nonomuraea phyllanthi]